MKVDYGPFSEKFSQSRKNMKWGEIDYFVSKIDKDIVKPGILDIGCGNGRLLESLDADISYLGIDSSGAMTEEAKKLHPEYTFRTGVMTNIDEVVSGNKYDYVFLIASFHHLDCIEHRIETLNRIKRVLKPHGKIFLTNWNLTEQDRYIKSRTKEFEDASMDFSIKFGKHDRYYHGFTVDTLQNLYESCGFFVEEHTIFEGGRNILSILTHGEK